MRRVILESPFGANPPLFVAYARACIKDCLRRDEAAIASHLLYTQPGILDDAVVEERRLGMRAGFEWYQVAEASVVYRDYGISEGMQRGIDLAIGYGLAIEYRNLPTHRVAYDGVMEAFPVRPPMVIPTLIDLNRLKD